MPTGTELVDLVWLNNAPIPNFSIKGAQIYLPEWVGHWVDVTLILRLISVPNWTGTELANWN